MLITLLSVELQETIFCSHDPLNIEPDPRDIVAPVCPHILGWFINDASIHQHMQTDPSLLKTKAM